MPPQHQVRLTEEAAQKPLVHGQLFIPPRPPRAVLTAKAPARAQMIHPVLRLFLPAVNGVGKGVPGAFRRFPEAPGKEVLFPALAQGLTPHLAEQALPLFLAASQHRGLGKPLSVKKAERGKDLPVRAFVRVLQGRHGLVPLEHGRIGKPPGGLLRQTVNHGQLCAPPP